MLDELVLRGTRIVVPAFVQQAVVMLAHECHEGMVRTNQYLQTSLLFPGMEQMVETVDRCMTCKASTDIFQNEPPKPTELP